MHAVTGIPCWFQKIIIIKFNKQKYISNSTYKAIVFSNVQYICILPIYLPAASPLHDAKQGKYENIYIEVHINIDIPYKAACYILLNVIYKQNIDIVHTAPYKWPKHNHYGLKKKRLNQITMATGIVDFQ